MRGKSMERQKNNSTNKDSYIDWSSVKKTLEEQKERVGILMQLLNIKDKAQQIEALELKAANPSFWDDQEKAKNIMSDLDSLKSEYEQWLYLDKSIGELSELYTLASQEDDISLFDDIKQSVDGFEKDLLVLELKTKLGGIHDKSDAIVSIHSGAGGTESCDWVAMLARMYSRWAEKRNYAVEVVYSLDGEEAGLKNITMIIRGRVKTAPSYIYGLLCSEIGVHRLVRISPFDSNKRRHTTFACVDVIPEIEDAVDIVIEDKDIRIDTYRASGAGGQHVNTTDSAVRITHIPTGIISQSQNDRSQIKNRVTALKLLKARLYELEIEKQRQSFEKHYNDKGAIEGGNQIRSYIFMPYQLVKDHRTDYETAQINSVMDGDLEGFISAYLTHKNKK
jgi:peptide chain release factor 2